MAQVGFALLAAHENGASLDILAERLVLPVEWIQERIEAARLCLRDQ
ncbi:MAG TPA: hypothetical protein VMZ52_03915 [Bryobacteraceae bacterium]|nr:hypothetical protein [Bryobacteraceae bacterium]